MIAETLAQTRLNPTSLEIGLAQPADLLAAWDIWSAGRVANYGRPEFGTTPEAFRAHLLATRNGQLATWQAADCIYIAKQDAVVVGMVAPTVDEAGNRQLEGLYVKQNAQRQGIGRALTRLVIKLFAGHPIQLVVAAHTGADRLYRQEGFQAIESFDEIVSPGRLPVPKLKMTRPADLIH